jgi:hypothetical protein
MLAQVFTQLYPWGEAGGWRNHRDLVGATEQCFTEHPWYVSGP